MSAQPDAILVVDDSLTVRMDLTEALEAAALRVVPCASIAEARAALAREPIAVVILDVVLPDGDGVALLSELRADPARADLPIVMLSSEAEVKDRIRGLTTGADDYVGKPYDTTFVVARVRELARRRARVPERPCVLVIDDSATYRDRLRGALEAAGYHVQTAVDGTRGLAAASLQRPHAIIVDGVMPDLDGATVIRRVRLDPALRTTPCVLLTGSSGAATELAALDAGADAFVRKDDDLDVILARIGTVLRGTAESVATASLLGPKRILAVDDSPTYLHTLADALRAEGYDVVLARSGEEALEMLAVQAVDCVLLDLQMPGIGGDETCRRIKASAPLRDLPLVMLTSLEDRDAMLRGLGAGADDYISKSAELEVLKARVRAQIRRKQFEDEHRRVREELLRSEIEAAEARAARDLAGALTRKNKELEAFSYSVSHDLRTPLRTISGFSQAVLEQDGDKLGDRGRDYLRRVCAAAQRMSELIDDLIELSRINRIELSRVRVDLGQVARTIFDDLVRRDPERRVAFTTTGALVVRVDPGLIRVLLDNLVGNAWKFTSRAAAPRVEIGAFARGEDLVYFVRDNGAGFDMTYAGKLFGPFQRLHTEAEFPGTGIGLSISQRIVDRHGGRIWAEAAVGRGATIFFTLPDPKPEHVVKPAAQAG